MKRQPIVAAILVAVTLYACTKDQNARPLHDLSTDTSVVDTSITDDSVYKAKIEQLLNTKMRPSTAEERDTSNHKVIHLPFKTFKAEYEYFDSVMRSKSSFANPVPMTITGTNTRLSTKTKDGANTLVVSYEQSGSAGGPISGLPLANADAFIDIDFQWSIQYTPNSSGGYTGTLLSSYGSITSYLVSPSVGYVGAGSQGSVANNTISAALIVYMEANGATTQILVNISGSYTIGIPITPTGQSTLTVGSSASLE